MALAPSYVVRLEMFRMNVKSLTTKIPDHNRGGFSLRVSLRRRGRLGEALLLWLCVSSWVLVKDAGIPGGPAPTRPRSWSRKFINQRTCIPMTPSVLRISVSWSLICIVSLKSSMECRPSISLSKEDTRSTLDSIVSNNDKKYWSRDS